MTRVDEPHGAMNGPADILVLDTCVLISGVLRTLLLDLAADAWFRPVWSARIGHEWRRTAVHLWQTDAGDVAAQWAALQSRFPAADLGDVSSYEQGLRDSDPKDWHVVAAGRAAQHHLGSCGVTIVTRNLRDFHRTELRRLGIGLLDPDRLISRWWSRDPAALAPYLERLPQRSCPPGRSELPLETLLKQERLFRLNRLCGRAVFGA